MFHNTYNVHRLVLHAMDYEISHVLNNTHLVNYNIMLRTTLAVQGIRIALVQPKM